LRICKRKAIMSYRQSITEKEVNMRVSSHAKTKQKGQASEDSLPVLVSPKEIKTLLSVCPLYKNLALTIPPHWKLSGIASQGLSVVCLSGQQALWIETLVGEVIAILRNGYYFFLNKMKLIVNYEKKSKKNYSKYFSFIRWGSKLSSYEWRI
jgi:hypothetical protein